MPRALEVKPSGPPPQDPYTQLVLTLIVVLLLTVSGLSYLAKSYSVSGLTPLPHIPKQRHFIQKSAHEVLDANWEARVMPVFT